MAKKSPNSPCPCGQGAKYKKCCGPLHRGSPADTPERLMRSRFAAYALGLVTYIIETTDPSGSAWQADIDQWKRGVESFVAQTDFVSLQIVEAPPPSESDGTVHFKATLRTAAGESIMDERSRFRRVDGHWKYHSGVQPG